MQLVLLYRILRSPLERAQRFHANFYINQVNSCLKLEKSIKKECSAKETLVAGESNKALKNSNVFWHQSEVRTAATVWNWPGKTLSPGTLLAVLYFSSCHIFFRPFRLSLFPTICPWVSEDVVTHDINR